MSNANNDVSSSISAMVGGADAGGCAKRSRKQQRPRHAVRYVPDAPIAVDAHDGVHGTEEAAAQSSYNYVSGSACKGAAEIGNLHISKWARGLEEVEEEEEEEGGKEREEVEEEEEEEEVEELEELEEEEEEEAEEEEEEEEEEEAEEVEEEEQEEEEEAPLSWHKRDGNWAALARCRGKSLGHHARVEEQVEEEEEEDEQEEEEEEDAEDEEDEKEEEEEEEEVEEEEEEEEEEAEDALTRAYNNYFNDGYLVKRTSQFHGVSWNKAGRKWSAKCHGNHLGGYTTEVGPDRQCSSSPRHVLTFLARNKGQNV